MFLDCHNRDPVYKYVIVSELAIHHIVSVVQSLQLCKIWQTSAYLHEIFVIHLKKVSEEFVNTIDFAVR